jgi:hypothetical protein
LDSAGNIYVADQQNTIIRKVTPAGYVTTLAGLPLRPGSTDGTGIAVGFAYAEGVAVDGAGNVYAADTQNDTIRKGQPENAPAIISTSSPQLGFTNGQFGFQLTGPAGQLVVVEISTDLVSWLPVWTNTFPGIGTNLSALTFTDPQSATFPHSFYRALTP